jgi:hypothetical protein
MKLNNVRPVRRIRFCGGKRRLFQRGKDDGGLKVRSKSSRQVKPERAVTIASGEMYPERGISVGGVPSWLVETCERRDSAK